MTEELRERGAEGRELVEGEEAVELVDDFRRAFITTPIEQPPSSPPPRRARTTPSKLLIEHRRVVITTPIERPPSSPPPRRARTTPSKLLIEREEDAEVMRRSLASMYTVNIRPKPYPETSRGLGIAIEELERESLERREAKRASGVRFAQPTATEFLSRPYHKMGYSRFLFSSPNEPDGYSLNRGGVYGKQ